MGDHGFLGKGFHYDCVIRTPLIFAGPGIKQQRIDEVETVLDLAPTLLDVVGVDEIEGTQGISLKEVLNGAAAPRDAVMTENDDDFGPMYVRTLTTKDWKLTYYLNQSLGELYDRKNDPDEMVNLWNRSEHAGTKQELHPAAARGGDGSDGSLQWSATSPCHALAQGRRWATRLNLLNENKLW